MPVIRAIRALGPIDVRSVSRDSLLRWLAFMPVFMALGMRWGVPAIAAHVRVEYDFDLLPYYPLLLSFLALMAPSIAGVVVGFLLLDERDDNTIAALQVTPLTLNGFLLYRITTPMALSVVMTLVALPLAGLARIGPAGLCVVALGAAPTAPLFALFLAGFANNKVQGFALMKAAGVLNWPPVIAWFLPLVWQWVMGVVPTYWSAKLVWMLAAGEKGVWAYLVVGLLYQLVLLKLLLMRFNTVMHR